MTPDGNRKVIYLWCKEAQNITVNVGGEGFIKKVNPTCNHAAQHITMATTIPLSFQSEAYESLAMLSNNMDETNQGKQ